MYQYRKLKTPIGELKLIGKDDVVECILFEGTPLPLLYKNNLKESHTAYNQAAREMKEYFNGNITQFTFPFNLISDGFTKQALKALAKVAYGVTISYKQLAERAGSGKAFRAAGSACASNPLPIVIPCHRVLKSDGTLGGFGGGLKVKRQLLDLEKAKYKN